MQTQSLDYPLVEGMDSTCELDAPIMEIRHGADILRLHFEDED